MDINRAKSFLDNLHKENLMYHLEDDAEDCLGGLIPNDKIKLIQQKVNNIYNANLDWGKFKCPIGYSLHIMKL
tara:strand:+ start:199 stop:417 length:219 start_codon:yes stop_codon:yes gene_type:complete